MFTVSETVNDVLRSHLPGTNTLATNNIVISGYFLLHINNLMVKFLFTFILHSFVVSVAKPKQNTESEKIVKIMMKSVISFSFMSLLVLMASVYCEEKPESKLKIGIKKRVSWVRKSILREKSSKDFHEIFFLITSEPIAFIF